MWNFWFNRRQPGARTQESFDKNLKKVGEFNTVEGYWRYAHQMIRPNDLPNSCDYSLFRAGVKPMWEHDDNRNGGKWIVRIRKGQATRSWENLLLALTGDEFGLGCEICGAVISIRFQEDIISVWNATAEDYEAVQTIRNVLRQALNLPAQVSMEYRRHDVSIRDNCSFRPSGHSANEVAAGKNKA